MNWKEQFENVEKQFGQHAERDWKPVIDLVQNAIKNNPDDVEAYIRTIYLLHNVLVEEDYTALEHDYMAELLKKYFNQSFFKFKENTEYLFFIGKILHISEWYFGLDDDIKSNDESLAFKMQKKAYENEPENILFEWAYRLSSNDATAVTLAKKILNDSDKIQWLKSKGFPGSYFLEHLEACAQK